MNIRVLRSLGAVLLPALLATGCQRYDFEPVKPLAVVQNATASDLVGSLLKANVMLLVDKSGSMDQPIDKTVPGCTNPPNPYTCGGRKDDPCNVSVCPTRWSELSQAVDQFLANPQPVARYGLSFFPDPTPSNECNGTSAASSDLAPAGNDDSAATLDALSQSARTALSQVQSTNPPGPTGTGGGTPTGSSLQYFLGYPQLGDSLRTNLILLLTDGLPNCNASLPPEVVQNPDTCQCTVGDQSTCAVNYPSGIGCLDKDKTVSLIQTLRTDKKIGTVVVGFGADTSGDSARSTLEAMAEAGESVPGSGGFAPRECPGGNGACGPNNPCGPTGLCSKQYFEATDSASLTSALAEISASVGKAACRVAISPQPSDPSLISILVDGNPVLKGPDSWDYVPPADANDAPHVLFAGALCQQIAVATPDKPVKVQIRVLQVL